MQYFSTRTKPDVFSARWLNDVPPAAIEKLRSVSDRISIPNRGTVYGLGAEQRWLWGISSGQVRVHVSLNEMEPVLGHIHQAGAWFGESEPLQQLPGLVEMQAAGEISVARIDFARFRAIADSVSPCWM